MTAEDVLRAVIRALNEAAIPYMVVGSFASNFYGIQRSTQDADFLLQTPDIPLAVLRQHLGPEFKIDSQSKIESITMGTYYVIQHPESDFTIELFLLREDSYDQLNFSRRSLVSYGHGQAFLPAPEDVVITKLRWSKSGRRNKDISDVRDVLAVQQGKLDLAYIRHWCDQQGTRALLEEVLESIPPIPPP